VNEQTTAQYKLIVKYDDDTSKTLTSGPKWSEDSGYASINSSGMLTTDPVTSDQSCTITAEYEGLSDTHKITIKNVPPDHVTISGPTSVVENLSAQYTLKAYYKDGSSKTVTSSASWSVDCSNYASISSGKLTAKSVSSDQSCTITSSYEGKSDTHKVTIKNAILDYIRISGPTSVDEYSSAQYTLKAYYTDGSSKTVTNSADWSENCGSYASFDYYDPPGKLTTGIVSSDQSCTITAKYGGKTDTHNITIKNVPPILDYVTIYGVYNVNENSTEQYTLKAFYTNGDSKYVTNSADWSENCGSYASISSSGKLTTYSVSSDQSCTITAKYGGKTDTFNITIKNGGSIL
jgi:uncharacterized protein YxeA